MEAIVEVAPISDLRHRQREIMDLLGRGPVILTQHGRGAAVLLSMQQWQEMSECLQAVRDAEALRALYEEFDAEERELAQAGAEHYTRILQEDETGA